MTCPNCDRDFEGFICPNCGYAGGASKRTEAVLLAIFAALPLAYMGGCGLYTSLPDLGKRGDSGFYAQMIAVISGGMLLVSGWATVWIFRAWRKK